MKAFIRTTAGVLVAGAVAAGCSTAPSQNDVAAANAAIGNAGHAIDNAAADPHVAQYAPGELQRAQESQRKAQAAWDEHHDLKATTHFAYLAQQRAATARELASERAAEESIKVAAAERDHAVSIAAAGGRPGASREGRESVANFATGKAVLPTEAMPRIDELAAMLRDNPQRKVVIDGHTDSVGNPAYNQKLAMARAQAVRSALVSRGIDPGRVLIRSSGEENPVASNDTRAGRRENRRAEVIMTGAEAQVAGAPPEAAGTAATGASGLKGQTGQGAGHEQNAPGQQAQQRQHNEQGEQDDQDNNERKRQPPPQEQE